MVEEMRDCQPIGAALRVMGSKFIQWTCLLQSRPPPNCRRVGAGTAAGLSLHPDSAMLGLVGRVAAASASGALRGLSPSAPLPQAQLLLRAAPAALQPGKCLPLGAGFVSAAPWPWVGGRLSLGPKGSVVLEGRQGQCPAFWWEEDKNGSPLGAFFDLIPSHFGKGALCDG